MTRPARALVDLDALQANLRRVRAAAPGRRVMAVVKANGYGHGLQSVGAALGEADALGVACLEEALVLREAGVLHPVVLLEGCFEPAELAQAARHHLDIVVHHAEQVRALERAALPRPVAVWLKLDTGMHRLGFPPGEAAAVHARLMGCPGVGRVRLMSHLACADERDNPRTREQLAVFDAAARGLDGERSLANSAGVLAWPETHLDWVRPGIMLYGVSPFEGGTGPELGLAPVMTLSTRLVAVNRLRAGDAVGYGGAWVCPEDMPVGVAAIGYGDGYPRHAPAGTPVRVGGRVAPLVGRVSMDMLCVDLRGHPDARVGDPVTLWGPELPVETVARAAGTIGYELLCGVTTRVAVDVRRERGSAVG